MSCSQQAAHRTKRVERGSRRRSDDLDFQQGEAGQEHSVAATKTVIGSMAASAALVAELAGDRALRSALDRLPECLHRALALDWSEIVDDLAKA